MIMYGDPVKGTTPNRTTPLTEARVDAIASAFKALSEPTRIRLIAAILNEERCVHELCAELGLEQSAVSHQLRILRDQKLVRRRKEGRHVYYALDDVHIRELFEVALTHVSHGQRVGR
jgi:DNA-binding transcriptional ArsR family regulator